MFGLSRLMLTSFEIGFAPFAPAGSAKLSPLGHPNLSGSCSGKVDVGQRTMAPELLSSWLSLSEIPNCGRKPTQTLSPSDS